MKSWRLTPNGGIDGLLSTNVPDPEPGPGEVLVRVRATSLNYRDYLIAKNGRTAITPLSDGAGEVIGVGAGVHGFAVGDRVAGCFFVNWQDGDVTPASTRLSLGGGNVDGMLCELRALPSHAVVHIPAYMTYEEAATLPCAAVTVWNAMFAEGKMFPGQSVLLLGTGGVSIFGLQLAKIAGIRSIITSSSDAKLERARELGADVTINYRTNPEWEKAVLDSTDGHGVDLVLEVGGAATFPKSMAATRFGGRIELIGALAHEGVDPGTAPLVGKNIRATRIYVGSRRMFEEMNRALALREVHPVIDRTFPFDDAPAAYKLLASQTHFGKVVITV